MRAQSQWHFTREVFREISRLCSSSTMMIPTSSVEFPHHRNAPGSLLQASYDLRTSCKSNQKAAKWIYLKSSFNARTRILISDESSRPQVRDNASYVIHFKVQQAIIRQGLISNRP